MKFDDDVTGQCKFTNAEETTDIDGGNLLITTCNISGVDNDDSVLSTLMDTHSCFEISNVGAGMNGASIVIRIDCNFATKPGTEAQIAVLVYDK